MSWINLVWIVLYFAAGWALTEACGPGDDIWKLLVFLFWPVLLGILLVLLVLLVLFSLVVVAEELLYGLTHKEG